MSAETPEDRPPEVPLPPPPPSPPPAWRPPRPEQRSSAWKWGCGFGLAGCLLVILIGFLIVFGLAVSGARATGRGISTGSGPILLIPISGVIVAGEASASFLTGGETGSDDVVRQIETAMDDAEIKAILLRVNSPGGSAAGAQEIYNAVARAKRSGKKVVVSMADVATSGGYYVSSNADKIFADPATMTGSIGVIAMHSDYSGLLGKVGVKVDTLKSGQYKDMFSPTRPLAPGERQLMQTIITQVYQQFVTAVAEGRNMDKAMVRKLGDGRIYVGTQAKEMRLVDELGGLHEALVETGKMVRYAGKPRYRQYGPPSLLRRLLGGSVFSGSGRRSAVSVSSGGLLYDEVAARLVGQALFNPEQGAAPMPRATAGTAD